MTGKKKDSDEKAGLERPYDVPESLWDALPKVGRPAFVAHLETLEEGPRAAYIWGHMPPDYKKNNPR